MVTIDADQHVDRKARSIDERGYRGQAQAAAARKHRYVIERRAARQRERPIERMRCNARQQRLTASIHVFHLTGAKSIHGHRLVYDRHFVSSSWARSPVLPTTA
ncbi:MAG TPA: hypothetical protein VNM90_30110 [Haliangium sp.]|nr:hypothetical protein [Haliangium sp.]